VSVVSCYVYYRVAPGQATKAREAVAAAFATLEERHGIVGRLMKGVEEPLLWMEIYENLREHARVLSELEGMLAEHGFAALLAPGSVRRTERFVAQP